MFFFNFFWTLGDKWMGPIKLCLSILPSFCLSFHPSFCPGVFLESYNKFFLMFGMVLETYMKLCVTGLDFPGKKICCQNWKNMPKTVFFELNEKFGHWFLLNLFYSENRYFLLCSCTSPMFAKIFVPEIWARMFSANQIAGYFNQPYLQNKSV